MKIYNTMTRKKEEFIPLRTGEVSMYVCGPTVYNFFHIGNARTFLVFDTIRKYFEYRGYKVNFVQNFTDIDDKMINKANAEETTVKELGDRFIKEYYQDADGLNIQRATVNPRATEFMVEIVAFVKDLIDKGFAYEVDGDVYFSTKKFDGYGKLSGQNLEDLQAGSRINVDERKNDPMDFAIWKSKKPNEPSWPSHWGEGRPGWHIECSCMAHKLLGETIDIHAGGSDLMFPHHENEIAQSEARTGKTFAKYWMHSAYLNVDNRKMSKSLNNFFTARDILKNYDADVVRLFMLSVHYRTQLNYSVDFLDSAKVSLQRFTNVISKLEELLGEAKVEELTETDIEFEKSLEGYKQKYLEKMDDDFNTADAISVMFDAVRDINININSNSSKAIINLSLGLIRELGRPLGILEKKEKISLEEEVEKLIEMRQQARVNKDWSLSDKIRDELKAKGIVLEDTPQGVRWKLI